MRWRVLAVVLALALAGCGSVVGFGGAGPTETVTPAPVPTPSPTPDDPRVGVAPGVAAEGIFDEGYLIQRHVEAASGTRYVWESHERRTYGGANQSVSTDRTQRVVFENGTTYLREASSLEQHVDGQRAFLQDLAIYADGQERHSKWIQLGAPEVIYRRQAATNASRRLASLPTGAIREYVAFDDQRVERIGSVGDQAHYRVTGTTDSLLTYGPVQNYTGEVLVRADGLIRSVDVSFETIESNQSVRITYSSNYSQLGEATVTRPEWLPDARQALSRTPTPDGTPAG